MPGVDVASVRTMIEQMRSSLNMENYYDASRLGNADGPQRTVEADEYLHVEDSNAATQEAVPITAGDSVLDSTTRSGVASGDLVQKFEDGLRVPVGDNILYKIPYDDLNSEYNATGERSGTTRKHKWSDNILGVDYSDASSVLDTDRCGWVGLPCKPRNDNEVDSDDSHSDDDKDLWQPEEEGVTRYLWKYFYSARPLPE